MLERNRSTFSSQTMNLFQLFFKFWNNLKKNRDLFLMKLFIVSHLIISVITLFYYTGFYSAMIFYCITLFHYNKAEVILLTLDFDVVCDIWACAQLSLDLAGEVQQLQEVVHSQLVPDNNTHTIKYSSCMWVWP